MQRASTKRGFSLPSEPTSTLDWDQRVVYVLCWCSLPFSYPPSFTPPPSVSLSPQRVRLRREDGAQRGSAPSWLWPEAKSPHYSCIFTFLNEKWGKQIRTPHPQNLYLHMYIKLYITTTTFSPQFLYTYLNYSPCFFTKNTSQFLTVSSACLIA